jgi:hypothetical protein
MSDVQPEHSSGGDRLRSPLLSSAARVADVSPVGGGQTAGTLSRGMQDAALQSSPCTPQVSAYKAQLYAVCSSCIFCNGMYVNSLMQAQAMQVSGRHRDASAKQQADESTSYAREGDKSAVPSATPTLMEDDEDMAMDAAEPVPSCRDSMLLSESSLSSALPAQGSLGSEWRNTLTSRASSGVAPDATSSPVRLDPPKLLSISQLSPDEVRKLCRMNVVLLK